jgi:hypothetical protein
VDHFTPVSLNSRDRAMAGQKREFQVFYGIIRQSVEKSVEKSIDRPHKAVT